MKRVFWALGLALFGLYLGWNGQGHDFDLRQILTATLWAGSIGFEFGSIFDRHVSGAWRIFYWAATLALVGLFFGPLLPITSFIVGQVLGAFIGALIGFLIGILQLKFARRKSQSPTASAIG